MLPTQKNSDDADMDADSSDSDEDSEDAENSGSLTPALQVLDSLLSWLVHINNAYFCTHFHFQVCIHSYAR